MPQSYLPGQALYLSAVGDTKVGGAGSQAVLDKVTINTPVASAVVTIYDGTSTTGTKIATIAASGTLPVTLGYGIRCHNGVYAVMTGGNADVTVVVI